MKTGNTQIAVKRAGPLCYRERLPSMDSDDKTIVFLHGNSFSGSVFEKQFTGPTLSGYRLIAFDLPGHGESRAYRSDTQYTFEKIANSIEAGLNLLKLENVILAGWSLGGHVALEMLDRVDIVSGAMIFGAPPIHNGALSMLRAYHFSLDMLLASKGQFTSSDARRFERLCVGPHAQGRFVESILKTAPAARPSIAKGVLNGMNSDQLVLANNATKPLCILQGENDPLVHSGYIKRYANSVDFAGEFVGVPNAGHAPFFDEAYQFDTALWNFAESVRNVGLGQTQQEKRAA